MVSWAGIKIACLVSQSTMTKIVSNLEDDRSFLIKSMEMEFHGRSGIIVHLHRGWTRSICSRLIPVFCFDQNVRQGCDHDCTGERICRGYQQMVHKFCCQVEVDCLGL